MRALLTGLTWRRALLVVVDHVLMVLAVLAAVWIRNPEIRPTGWALLWRAVLIAGILQLCLHYADLYDVRRLRNRRDLIERLLQALSAGAVILALLYYWVPQLVLGRGVFLIGGLLTSVLLVGWRVLFEWLSSNVGPTERVLFLGTNSAAVELARELYDRRHSLGVDLVGFVDVGDTHRAPGEPLNSAIVGHISDIPRLVREYGVDRVVVSMGDTRGKLPMDQLLEMKLTNGVRFDHLASVYEEYTGKIAIENLRPSWLIFSEGFRKTRTLQASKRIFDVVVASIGLVLAAPLMLLVALAIKATSPGPVFYHQKRVGQNGTIFTVHKFRSMHQDAEKATGAVWSTANDPRVTPVGRFLRRTRLDELPQLWNVLRGDMSIVGPRPERPEFVADLTQRIPFYGQRHVVRPGLTGWAQVRHRYGSSVEDALQKLQFDLFYIKHMSISFDCFVLLETVKTVIMRPGS
ncbi:MAG TPA: TIGR03013 family XrtA/PEP-CTERM system glycosyltransferase [Vicinamibacterales bacterium]